MAIKSYTSVAASNTSLFPEGMAPSAVNDAARQVQADIRQWYMDSEWIDRGDSGISRASATTFKITSDVTAAYVANRRIKCYDATTLYGVITASSYSAPDTTVTVGLDSGSLTTSLTSVAVASISPSNLSIPTTIGFKGADIASATTTNLTTATGDFVDVTGTTTITAFGTIAAGVQRTVRFTGALTLTHNATSLILPSSANITTANGDVAIFRSLGSGNWKCISYVPQTGNAVYKCGFHAYVGSNVLDVTGDGTTYTIICDTEITDYRANYNNATGVFTAEKTGLHLLTALVHVGGLTSSHISGDGPYFSTTNRNYFCKSKNFYADALVGTDHYMNISTIADMVATDTAVVKIHIAGGAKVVDIKNDGTFFSGMFLG